MQQSQSQLSNLNFINSALNNLPVEKEIDQTQRKVRGYCFSPSETEEKENPQIAALSLKALKLLDIEKGEELYNELESIEILAGNKQPKGSKVLAHCYCGYQFGSWANQLGDGRAHLLGDIKNKDNQLWELQYKGSGMTPYSRSADGKAVIRSSVREFLCSEAMHALGIPTTRAASLIVSDTEAERDKLYTGNIIKERCAVVLRLSPTFLRFGSFQICVNEPGNPGPSVLLEKTLLPKLMDYTIKHHYPEIWNKYPEQVQNSSEIKDKEAMYLEMYQELVKRTAELVAKWQSVGFVHGVLNTDNMSIIGVTIDYGPYEFVDHFSKRHISNHSDRGGRYSYEQQPSVCKWNLGKLADALEPVLDLQKSKDFLNKNYDSMFQQEYLRLFRNKLGLQRELEEDQKLIEDLFEVLDENMSEFTNTFKLLKEFEIEKGFSGELSQSDLDNIDKLVQLSPSKQYIMEKKKPIASVNQLFQLQQIGKQNPMQLLMMGVDEEFVQNELIKAVAFEELKEIEEDDLQTVYKQNWVNWVQKYKERLDLEIQESEDIKEIQLKRQEKMVNSNPQFVLRNYIAEEIIKECEKNNFKPVNEALKLLENPFKQYSNDDESKVCKIEQITPSWAKGLCVSCSS